MALLSFLLLLPALAQCAPLIFWMSEPTFPNETLVLHGAGFDAQCDLTVSPSPASIGAPVTLRSVAGQASPSSLKFFLPPTLPLAAFSLALSCPTTGNYTHTSLLNGASAWWHQGDIGNAASQGGWVRVLGPTLALQPPASLEAALLAEIRRARDALAQPASAADAAWEDNSPLAAAAAALLALRARLAAVRAAPQHRRAFLRLRSTAGGGGGALYLPATADSLAPHSATFALPQSLATGEYTLAVANGAGEDTDPAAPPGAGTFAPLSFFESVARPRVETISVLPPPAWPPGVFPVDTPSDPCSPSPLPCPTSDASLQRALAQAQAAGGGTVLLPRGSYFLTQPVALPPNTVIAGAGAEEVSLWFAEWNTTSAPKAPLFSLNDTLARAAMGAPCLGSSPPGTGVASWGLANLTLYLTAFHNDVIVASNATDGFLLAGLRVRANPFAFVWGSGPAMGSRGRVANFTTAQVGQLIDLHSVNNRILGNDLFGVNIVMNSCYSDGCCGKDGWGGPGQGWRRGHAYSRIADNVIYNGQASHYMQLWRQVLFERNVIRGSTTTAGGQSLGTGPMGGTAQHIYHADNHIHFTWGGDREVMTYDDAGGSYWGPLAGVDGATLTLAGDAWPASDWEMGGWWGGQVLVLNGTGQGQFGRVLIAGVNTTRAPSNRTWVLSEPLPVPPAVGSSFVQIMPFRGRNIFFRDTNEDTGPHQFYGHAVQNLVTDVRFVRVRGLMAWGQWRGWVPPNASSLSGAQRGVMGNGMQPNHQNVYRGVAFSERHHLTNYACGEAGYTEQWGWKNIVLYPDALALNSNQSLKSPHPLNTGIVFRGASLMGGVWVGNGTSDLVVENCNISWGGEQCIGRGGVDDLVYEAGNACSA
jgi:hypothetical protein